MSETSEDIVLQSCEILQTFVMVEGGGGTIQTSIKFCDFAEPYLC